MSAEEKAKELADKYYGLCDEYVVFADYHKLQLAKKSAIVAVDEIIGLLEKLSSPEYVAFLLKDQVSIETEYETHLHGYELKQFYEDVRVNLEKL